MGNLGSPTSLESRVIAVIGNPKFSPQLKGHALIAVWNSIYKVDVFPELLPRWLKPTSSVPLRRTEVLLHPHRDTATLEAL